MTSQELNWVAGIVEGEGCIIWTKTPNLRVVMTDKDVMERLASYWKTKLYTYHRGHENGRKTQYVLNMFGSKAVSWMFTLYSLLGLRRRAKIEEVIAQWKLSPGKAGWQKAFWQNKKEKASATVNARKVSGMERKSSNSGSNGGNKGKN